MRPGRIVAVSDRHGRIVRYGYDAEGRLTEVRDLAGNLWLHEYDAVDRLLAAVGVDGEPYLRVGYDAAGRVAWTSGEAEMHFEYGADRTRVDDRTSGERHVFERTNRGAVVGFASTTGIAWRLSLDAAARIETLAMSETAARLLDLEPHAFRPDGVPPHGRAPDEGWAQTIRFAHSPNGVASTETVSAAGSERRDYGYDGFGRLTDVRSSTGGIPSLRVDYARGVTVLYAGPAGSDVVFEFHAVPAGTVLLGNGRTTVEAERDGSAVAVLRALGRSVVFERDRLGRIVETRHADGRVGRYFLDDLGFRALAEYRGEGRLRFAIDPAGEVVAVERAGRTGDVRGGWLRWKAHERAGRLGSLTGNGPNPEQPDHGVVGFDGPSFAPVPRDPLTVGVPGFADARALASTVAALLGEHRGAVRAAFESPTGPASRPPEYRWTSAPRPSVGGMEETARSDHHHGAPYFPVLGFLHLALHRRCPDLQIGEGGVPRCLGL